MCGIAQVGEGKFRATRGIINRVEAGALKIKSGDLPKPFATQAPLAQYQFASAV